MKKYFILLCYFLSVSSFLEGQEAVQKNTNVSSNTVSQTPEQWLDKYRMASQKLSYIASLEKFIEGGFSPSLEILKTGSSYALELYDYKKLLLFSRLGNSLDASDANYSYDMGLALSALKDYEMAQAAFQVAVNIEGNKPRILLGLARNCVQLGLYRNARAYYRKILILDPSFGTARKELEALNDSTNSNDTVSRNKMSQGSLTHASSEKPTDTTQTQVDRQHLSNSNASSAISGNNQPSLQTQNQSQNTSANAPSVSNINSHTDNPDFSSGNGAVKSIPTNQERENSNIAHHKDEESNSNATSQDLSSE